MTAVDAVRDFNRFYTRRIGLLREHLSDSPFTLPEARVLYELARHQNRRATPTAADLTRELGMDKAHLSRLLARLSKRGLVASRISPDHKKHKLLSLTAAGRRAYAALERDTVTEMKALLAPLAPAQRARLTAAMSDIKTIIAAEAVAPVILRDPKPGDLAFVLHRQTVLYAAEYGWDWTYESLAGHIMAKFIDGYDPAREQAFIAERNGAVVGSVFLMRGDAPEVGKLRLLYVEPSARGLGLGQRLVDACIDAARTRGYRKLTLWTNDVLVSARRIYQAAGFKLVAQNDHRSFGKDLVGQTWDLELG